jgi:hypothetical protein
VSPAARASSRGDSRGVRWYDASQAWVRLCPYGDGLRPAIGYAGIHLQRRVEGQFADFTEPLPPAPPGIIIGETLQRFDLQLGTRLDRQLPLYRPAPPGTYRACFRYYPQMSSTERADVCSQAFTVP